MPSKERNEKVLNEAARTEKIPALSPKADFSIWKDVEAEKRKQITLDH